MQDAMKAVFDVYPETRFQVCVDDKKFNVQAERTEDGKHATTHKHNSICAQ